MGSRLDADVVREPPNHRLRLKLNAAVVPAFTKPAAVIFGLSVGLFITARLWRLSIYSWRPDDIFSLRAACHGWGDLLPFVVQDVVHPPLFYLLLKAWVSAGGESQLWLRLLPVLIAVAAIYPFFLLCRELGLGAAEINLAMVLMAVNGYLIYYAQELRMYSLLLFLTLWSLWLFIKFFNAAGSPWKHLPALFIVNLLLVYTQYYGWLIVGTESSFLLVWKRHKLSWFSVSVAILIICFSPWAYAVARVAARRGLDPNIGSFHRPNLIEDFVAYYVILTGPLRPLWATFLGLTLVGYSFLLWFAQVHAKNSSGNKSQVVVLYWLVFFSFLPSLFSYSASQTLSQSIWGTRFLIIVAIPYLMLVAVAVCRLHPSWLRQAGISLVVAWASMAGFQEVNRSNKNAWEPVVRQMIGVEQSQANGIVVYTFGSTGEVITFYLEEANEKRFQTQRIKDITDMRGDHFWVALRESFEKSPQQALMNKGYRIGKGYRDGFDGLLFPAWR